MFHLYLFSSLFAVIRTSFEYSWLSQDYKKLKTQRGTMWWTIFEVFGLVKKKKRLEIMLSSIRTMAVFILDYALPVWTNLGKHSLFVWLFVSSVKMGTRDIILLDELSSVERLEGRPFWSLAFWVISTFCKFAFDCLFSFLQNAFSDNLVFKISRGSVPLWRTFGLTPRWIASS